MRFKRPEPRAYLRRRSKGGNLRLRILAVVFLAIAVVATPDHAAFGASFTVNATADAQTPTPTATVTPTAAPTSRVGVRFIHNGQPVAIRLAQALSNLSADGATCLIPISGEVVISPGFSLDWPLVASPDQPAECSKGPPTTVRFEFLWWPFGETFIVLSAELGWTGTDMIVDLEVPTLASATVTSTAAPTATGTPVGAPTSTPIPGQRLPATGGRAGGDSGPGWAFIAVTGLGFAVSATVAFRRYYRR